MVSVVSVVGVVGLVGAVGAVRIVGAVRLPFGATRQSRFSAVRPRYHATPPAVTPASAPSESTRRKLSTESTEPADSTE